MGARAAVGYPEIGTGTSGRPGTRVPAAAWLRALLRVPLFLKLTGANAVIIIAALAVLWVAGRSAPGESGIAILAVALLAGVAANIVLVWLALRPLGLLESTAERVSDGDFTARVPMSPLADRSIARIGTVTNRLLERVVEDRERMRLLASKVISAQDEERARVARELHDSAAQSLAALALQLSAAARDSRDPDLAERLTLVRKIVGDVLEEIRAISRSMHPRVLDDLGLPAALEHLARQMRDRTPIEVEVEAAAVSELVSPVLTSALYRVAQEAITNALRHARATSVRVRLESVREGLRLTVQDDGTGFDLARAEADRPGMGLFSMRERVALVDGALQIHTARGRGTRVIATVPTDSPRST